MFKYELHLHTSETSWCGRVPAAVQVQRLKALGYDGLVVTDHLHAGYLEEVGPERTDANWQALIDRHMLGYTAAAAEGERLGVSVILCAELRFPEDERDYLAFGITEDWLRAHPYCILLSHEEFFDRYGKELLIVQAHPFRHYDDPDTAHLGGLEIVNCNPRHESRNRLALDRAKEWPGLVRTVGSDVHRDGDEGRGAVLFEKRVTTPAELREELLAGRFQLWCPDFEELVNESEAELGRPVFDTVIVGQICLDTNTDYDGRVEHRYGGAVLFSGHAAGMTGHKTGVVPKANPADIDAAEAFADCPNVRVYARPSAHSTLMENTYFTPDRERRRQVSPASIDPYTEEDLPEEQARIYHLAGLVTGDIDGGMIEACWRKTAKLRETDDRAGVALDVQCMLRAVEPDKTLKLYDWAEKKKYLPYIRYFKTDAAEAEMLTGLTDREAAARLMCEWGAQEVMITHNTEVIVCDGKEIYRAPLRPRNLSGRTGRGDTTFAGYINERLTKGIQESLDFAAALVSLKMETPGPFTGSRDDVLRFTEEVMG